jgi:hypothetical protein
MIPLALAQQLKQAGLKWEPTMHDFFAIPDRGMDNRIFVISDIQSTVENLFGSKVVAFQGASEWALDYLVSSEAVWLPTEAQLRQAIEEILLQSGNQNLTLTWALTGYRCTFVYAKRELSFQGSQADDAYAKGLLHLLGLRDGRGS